MKSKRALITLRLFAGRFFFSDASLPGARGLVHLELQGDRLVRRAFQNAGTATNEIVSSGFHVVFVLPGERSRVGDSGNPFGMACRRPSKGALFGLPIGGMDSALVVRIRTFPEACAFSSGGGPRNFVALGLYLAAGRAWRFARFTGCTNAWPLGFAPLCVGEACVGETMLTPIKVGRIDSLSDPARCLLLLLVDGGNLRRGAVFAPGLPLG